MIFASINTGGIKPCYKIHNKISGDFCAVVLDLVVHVLDCHNKKRKEKGPTKTELKLSESVPMADIEIIEF